LSNGPAEPREPPRFPRIDEQEIAMPNSTDPRDKPQSETAEEKAERERRELEKKRRELEERIEREKYERDNM
jgi:hypothetical protein